MPEHKDLGHDTVWCSMQDMHAKLKLPLRHRVGGWRCQTTHVLYSAWLACVCSAGVRAGTAPATQPRLYAEC